MGREGGHILTDKNNFLIALAPYFFPLYSILVLAIYGALSLFVNMQPYGRLLYALVGVTWAFHFTFTCWMIPKNQTDLRDNGTIFSLVVIYLINLLLLSAMLIIASPHITFASFGADIVRNIANFSHAVVDSLRALQPRSVTAAVSVVGPRRSRACRVLSGSAGGTPALRDGLEACAGAARTAIDESLRKLQRTVSRHFRPVKRSRPGSKTVRQLHRRIAPGVTDWGKSNARSKAAARGPRSICLPIRARRQCSNPQIRPSGRAAV